MMTNRRIIGNYRDKESGRFIARAGKQNDVRTFSRNIAFDGVNNSLPAQINSARSYTNNYGYRTQNNYSKQSCHFDWLTDSETGTPDFPSPDSDSSTSSLLSRADTAAAKRLREEWLKLERSLYNDEGPKVTQQHLIEECKQWRELYPHLRLVGRQLTFENNNDEPCIYESDVEIIAQHTSDERLDDTDQFFPNYHSSLNSSTSEHSKNDETLTYINEIPDNEILCYEDIPKWCKADYAPKKAQENENITKLIDQKQLELSLSSLLRITPLKLTNSSEVYRGSHYSSILRSEISSSKWRRNADSPNGFYSHIETNSSLPILKQQNYHNSAKPILTPENHKKNCAFSLSARENRTSQWKQPVNAAIQKKRDSGKLVPLSRPLPLFGNFVDNKSNTHYQGDAFHNRIYGKTNRKVSLPPIQTMDAMPRRTANSGMSSLKSNKKKSLIPLSIAENKKHEFGSDCNNSIMKVYENEQRRPLNKYSHVSKSLERY